MHNNQFAKNWKNPTLRAIDSIKRVLAPFDTGLRKEILGYVQTTPGLVMATPVVHGANQYTVARARIRSKSRSRTTGRAKKAA